MPLNIEVTQFPNGIGTVGDASVLNGVGSPLPSDGSINVNDFGGGEGYQNTYEEVAVGALAVASVLPNAAGVTRFTTPGVAAQGTALGVPAWMTARLDIADPVVNAFILGFVPGGSGLAPLDGVYLSCDAATGDVFIVARCDDFAVDGPPHVGHFFRSLVDEQDHHVDIGMVGDNTLRNLLQEECFTDLWWGDNQTALSFTNRTHQIYDACGDFIGVGFHIERVIGVQRR